MPLKDPPDYVVLDPALVYGVHNLQRETYQRLLKIIGWMWVTRKSGKPLGTTITELATKWDISERSVYHTLKQLSDKGYIEVSYKGGWAYIVKGPSCTTYNNTPGEPDTISQQAARGGDTESHASSLHEPAPLSEGNAKKWRSPNTSSVVVVGSTSGSKDQELQQLTSISPVQSALEQAGVFADKASELAADPWVTLSRVEGWVLHLEQDPKVRNVAAVLYSNLKNHREPPAPVWPELDRHRYIKGESGQYVKH